MPTGAETRLADSMLSCCAWYAQKVGGTKEFGGGHTVYVEPETHYARFGYEKNLPRAILFWFTDEAHYEHAYQGGGVVRRMA